MTSSSSLGAPTDKRSGEPVGAPLAALDLVLALVLVMGTVALLLKTMDLGFTRDEGYYFRAADLYLGWFKELAQNLESGDWRDSFTQKNIDKHWWYNSEHPAAPKALFGLSSWLFHEKLGWMSLRLLWSTALITCSFKRRRSRWR